MQIDILEKNKIKYLSFFATGTKWIITINPLSVLDETKKITETIVQDFENKYSRFIESSLLGTLKKEGEIANPPEDLIKMIQFGIDLEKISDGHFNLAYGNILDSRGYDNKYSFESSVETKTSDWLIDIKDDFIKIQKGTQLDFGAFGKGYLVDLLSNELKNLGTSDFTINAGGDIYYYSKDDTEKDFVLENPFDLTQYIGKISITNRAIASSSNNRRQWKDKNTGKTFKHISSFKELKEIEIAGIFTEAESTMNADAAATLLHLVDKNDFEKIEEKLKVSFLIIYNDGTYYKSKNYKGKLNED